MFRKIIVVFLQMNISNTTTYMHIDIWDYVRVRIHVYRCAFLSVLQYKLQISNVKEWEVTAKYSLKTDVGNNGSETQSPPQPQPQTPPQLTVRSNPFTNI